MGVTSRHLRATLAGLVCIAAIACSAGPPSPDPQARPRYSLDRLAELPPTLSIPLSRHGDHLFVRARLNGRDAGSFLFDLGSALTGVETGLARRFELPASGGGTVIGIGGSEPFTYRLVESLAIGDLGLRTRKVAALRLSRLGQGMRRPISGVVGFPSLRGVPFTVDYQASTLTVHQPDGFTAPPETHRAALWVHRGLPMVLAELGTARHVWLILDTGADNDLTLPTESVKRWPDIVAVPVSGPGASVGVGGRVASTQTWIRSLKLLGVDLREVPVKFEAPPKTLGRRGLLIGRIGNKLLQHFQLTFDARQKAVWAGWRPGG